jgi:hypothetical protein
MLIAVTKAGLIFVICHIAFLALVAMLFAGV